MELLECKKASPKSKKASQHRSTTEVHKHAAFDKNLCGREYVI